MNLIEKELRYGAKNYESLPVVIAKAHNATLTDTQGREYIDMMSAYSAASLGHANPQVLATLVAQASTLGVTSRAFFNDKLPLLLERLSDLSGLDKAIPMNSGAEGVETAIKLARKWGELEKKIEKDQCEIIVCHNNFHGRTLGVISFSTEPQYKANFGPFLPGFKYVPHGDAQALEAAITPNTAAFLIEPIQGEAGIIMPPVGYMEKVYEICQKNNVLLVLDEIQCGLTRTGKLFCFEHFGVKPDILILGKALGGGVYPVSAVLADNEIMNLIRPGDHGSTFGGNALASAVALTSLDLLASSTLIRNTKERGLWALDYLNKELQPYKEAGVVVDIRGLGLFIGVEFDAVLPAKTIVKDLMKEGVLTKDTHHTTIRLAPPLTISDEDLKTAIDKLVYCVGERVKRLV